MSDENLDVEGDESDLKESLLETLKSDGTLKQIQDQLSAAVYAAFYRQSTRPAERISGPLNDLMSKQSGINTASLFVDFLQSLGLTNSLKVFIHETGLSDLKLERRDDLVKSYNLPAVKEKVPVLSALLDSFPNNSALATKLSKAVVLDSENEREDHGLARKIANDVAGTNSPDFGSGLDVPINNKYPNSRDHSTKSETSQAPSLSSDPKSTHLVSSNKPPSGANRQNREEYLVVGAEDRSISTDLDTSVRTSNSAATDSRLLYQPSEPASHASSLFNPSTNGVARNSPSPSKASGSGSLYRPPTQRYQPESASDGDSDIDSEVVNDVTLNSSAVEDCDYMEPVRRLPRHPPERLGRLGAKATHLT